MNPTQMPANGKIEDTQPRDMKAEIERLRASLLEAEQRITVLQKQRDKYYEFTKLWIEQNCPMSDWDDFDPAEYTHVFDAAYIAELEARFKD